MLVSDLYPVSTLSVFSGRGKYVARDLGERQAEPCKDGGWVADAVCPRCKGEGRTTLDLGYIQMYPKCDLCCETGIRKGEFFSETIAENTPMGIRPECLIDDDPPDEW